MDFTEPVISPEQPTTIERSGSKKGGLNIPGLARLESEIDDIYTLIESKISTLWNKASRSVYAAPDEPSSHRNKGISHKQTSELDASSAPDSPSDDTMNSEQPVNASSIAVDLSSISYLTNKALNDLDYKLEFVEHKVGLLVSSITSFFSAAIESKTSEFVDSGSEFASPLPTIPGNAYGSSRYDMELFKLHTTDDIFLEAEPSKEAEPANFVVDDKTQEISCLLDQYPGTLRKMMEKLVPTKLTYNMFWYIYFKHESELRAGEKARQELLMHSEDQETADYTSDRYVHEKMVDSDNTERNAPTKLERKVQGGEEEEEGVDFEDFSWDNDE